MATYSIVIFCDDCMKGHFVVSGLVPHEWAATTGDNR
jgi:hypothetical protein